MSSPNQPVAMAQQGPRSGNLYDVLDLILDRGLVIDVFVRVSLLGLELLQIDARIVVASVDTYLRFAEATNRLDLEHTGRRQTLPGMIGEVTEQGSRGKVEGAVGGALDSITSGVRRAVGGDEDEDDERAEREPEPARPRRRRRGEED
jgi:hypothetical protein